MAQVVAKQQKNNRPKKLGGCTGKGFKPGKSGNPSGRRKGDVSLISAIKQDAQKNGVTKVVAKIRELAEDGDKHYIELLLKVLDADDWKQLNALPLGSTGGSGSYEITVRYVSGNDDKADN